jgi:DEAD/DEAH box helicase domain-containing protein
MVSIRNSSSFADWNLSVSRISEVFGILDTPFEFGNTLFGTWKPRLVNSHTTIYSGVVSDDIQKNKTKADIFVYALLNDDEEERTDKYEAEWNGYWQFVNVMQFLSRFAAVSATGLKQMVYGVMPIQNDTTPEQSPDKAVNAWKDTMEQIIDDSTSSFAKKCIELGIPEPSSVGFELLGVREDIIGEAELAWESMKIVYLTPEQLDSEEAFITNGWQVLKVDEEIELSLFKEVE